MSPPGMDKRDFDQAARLPSGPIPRAQREGTIEVEGRLYLAAKKRKRRNRQTAKEAAARLRRFLR